MRFRIYRYQPEQSDQPYLQDYTLDTPPGTVMLLDALMLLKAQDESFSFRRSCREGVCGSDAMNINGRNGLACITRLKDLAEPITLRPLPGMPVIRDLIVDLTSFYTQYRAVRPWLIDEGPEPEIERRQTPGDRDQLDGLYECVLCACCTTSCPVCLVGTRSVLGPAALCSPIGFFKTAAIRIAVGDSMTSKTLIACIAAIPS